MAGTDNILAGLEGLLGGVSSVAVPVLTHRANAAYDAELERKRREQELQQQISFLPYKTRAENEQAQFKSGLQPTEKAYTMNQETGQQIGEPIIGLPNENLKFNMVGGTKGLKPETVKQTEEEKLTAKYAAKKKQLFPKAKIAINNVTSSLDKAISNIDEILQDPDLNKVTGPLASRVGTITAGQARVRSKIDQLKSQAFLSSFTGLKSASPNGSSGMGALSDSEGAKLQKAAVNADEKQGTPDFKKGLMKYRAELVNSKQNFQSGYQDEYGDLIDSGGGQGGDASGYTPEQLKKLQELQGQ